MKTLFSIRLIIIVRYLSLLYHLVLYIYKKMKEKEISPEFLRKMDIPKQSKFAKIFNKNSAYRYMQNVREAVIVYNELLNKFVYFYPSEFDYTFYKFINFRGFFTSVQIIRGKYDGLEGRENHKVEISKSKFTGHGDW